MAEPVYFDVGELSFLHVFVNPSPDLAVADGDGTVPAVLAGKAELVGAIQRVEEGLDDLEDWIVADGVLGLWRRYRLAFSVLATPRNAPSDMELAIPEIVPFEAHEFAAAEAVVEEEGDHETVIFVVDDG